MPRIKKIPLTDTAEIQSIIPEKTESLPNIPPKSRSKKESVTTPTSDNKDLLKIEKKKDNLSTKESTIAIATKSTIPDTELPGAKLAEPKFKEIHIKDTFWLEKDVYQTLEDITKGKKTAKAVLINKAIRDYLKKNKIALQSFIAKK